MASTAPPTFLFPTMDQNLNKPPKSPKSPKPKTLENPLLKNPQFFMSAPSPSLVPEQQVPPRSPLLPLPMNNGGRQQLQAGAAAKPFLSTPGPPPRASLSLMGAMPVEPIAVSFPSPAVPQPVMTPPPVASPPLLLHSTATTSTTKQSVVVDDGNSYWVVAYGYTNQEEFQELVQIFNGIGRVLQQESNGNWLAIRYDSHLSAAKALGKQPIKLSGSSLCGTVPGSRELLHGLLSQPPSKPAVSGSSNSSIQPHQSLQQQRSLILDEKDILVGYSDEDYQVRQAPTSVCDRFLAWFFDWNYEPRTPRHHPHLD